MKIIREILAVFARFRPDFTEFRQDLCEFQLHFGEFREISGNDFIGRYHGY